MFEGGSKHMELITIEDPNENEIEPIVNGVIEYGLSQVGGIKPGKWAFHAKDSNMIIGGAIGRNHFSQFYLDHIWVEEANRSKGIGRQIHSEVIACAESCGCKRIQLNSLNKAAVTFYRGMGYETLATIEEYVDGFTLYYMAKRI